MEMKSIILLILMVMADHSQASGRGASTMGRGFNPRSHLSHPPILIPGAEPRVDPKLPNPNHIPKSDQMMSTRQSTQPKSMILCKGSESRDCKPSSVEYFASSVNRDGDKIIMLTFDFDKLLPDPITDTGTTLSNGGEAYSVKGHGDINTGDGSSVHVDIDSSGDVRVNSKGTSHSHNPSSPDSHRSSSRKDRITVCAPENEHVSLSQLTNQINLMSHVFCRQMGYMTYIGRSAANVIDDKERTIWPSVVCNGTEQRLEDCYWPDVTLTHCKQVLEVQCGSCSKYFSHVDDGVIMSPGFPNSFPFTVECDWLIYTHLGHGIELRFVTFNFPTSQLPMQQIGSSSCVAANAFLEIKPNGDTNPIHVQTLMNSNRYCVTRSPDRKMVIKSKAVWLHFSSGIHSSFFWNFRSRPFLKRPIGIKIYFKAIPNETDEEIDPESSITLYLVCGISGVVLITLVMLITVYICIKRRTSFRSGESKFSGDGNMNHHIQVVDSWRTATVSDGIGGSNLGSVMNHRDTATNGSSIIRPPPRFVSSSSPSRGSGGIVTESHHILHNCVQGKMQGLIQPPHQAFGRSNSSSALAMTCLPTRLPDEEIHSTNNYEEIPASRAPKLPPRFLNGQMIGVANGSGSGGQVTKEGPRSAWDKKYRRVSRRGQRSIYVVGKGRSSSHSEQLSNLDEGHLTDIELEQFDTQLGNNRLYMQIVCDSDGNCQYIPNHEILSSLPGQQSSFSSSSPSSLREGKNFEKKMKEENEREENEREESERRKEDSPHSLPPIPPTQLIQEENFENDERIKSEDKRIKSEDERKQEQKDTSQKQEKMKEKQKKQDEELMEMKKVNKSWTELKSESGSRIEGRGGIVMKMNKTPSLASVI